MMLQKGVGTTPGCSGLSLAYTACVPTDGLS